VPVKRQVAFYDFTRTIDAYKSASAENTTLVLSTDSEFFKFLNGMDPPGNNKRLAGRR
jgi:membrane protease subunit HflC